MKLFKLHYRGYDFDIERKGEELTATHSSPHHDIEAGKHFYVSAFCMSRLEKEIRRLVNWHLGDGDV